MSNLQIALTELSRTALRIKAERDEAMRLLGEAETNMRHKECIDEDAGRCAGCGLEAEINAFLKKVAS